MRVGTFRRRQSGFSLIAAFIALVLLIAPVVYFTMGRAVHIDAPVTAGDGYAQSTVAQAAALQAGFDLLHFKGESSETITLEKLYHPSGGAVVKRIPSRAGYIHDVYFQRAPWTHRINGIRVPGVGSGGYSDYIATGGLLAEVCTALNKMSGLPATILVEENMDDLLNPGTTAVGGTELGQKKQLDLTGILAGLPQLYGKTRFCLFTNKAPTSRLFFQIVVRK